jgi:hypothetical protein
MHGGLTGLSTSAEHIVIAGADHISLIVALGAASEAG